MPQKGQVHLFVIWISDTEFAICLYVLCLLGWVFNIIPLWPGYRGSTPSCRDSKSFT